MHVQPCHRRDDGEVEPVGVGVVLAQPPAVAGGAHEGREGRRASVATSVRALRHGRVDSLSPHARRYDSATKRRP